MALDQTAELREFNSRYKVEINCTYAYMWNTLCLQMNGFPFNVPYTSIADIILKVKNTEIYVNEDEDTEFERGMNVLEEYFSILKIEQAAQPSVGRNGLEKPGRRLIGVNARWRQQADKTIRLNQVHRPLDE